MSDPCKAPRTNVPSLTLSITLACLLGFAGDCLAEDPARLDYEKQIKGMLRERCFSCHGPLKQEASLRLDTRDSMLRGGDSGPAIDRTQPEKSLLIQRISDQDSERRMPPEHEGERLKEEQIALLQGWISQGAQAPDGEQAEPDPRSHWAFQPIQVPEIPRVPGGPSHPIDAFLHEVHLRNNLKPQPRAPDEVLLRRLAIDLIGLPPSEEDWKQFERDSRSRLDPATRDEEWYRKRVEQWLADPRHGERWARHWMDIWRFSDWWGLGDQLRNSQLHMWHWRDWIIESLNADRPYDEMVRLMLAADEIKPEDFSDLRATGFLARNFFLFNRNQWMDETVEHVSKSFLGLTMNCAKCHDHKYDPISQKDYYRMRAIFEPYHVRMDQIAGEPDLNKNGLPRIFDAHLELPTYRFVRGQESMPDKSMVMEPGIPEILARGPLDVRSVQLPAVAWQPERQPWVIPDLIAKAQGNVAGTAQEVEKANAKLIQAEQAYRTHQDQNRTPPTEKESPEVLLHEDFQTLDANRWKSFGGRWEHEPGKLQQLDGSQNRSVLRWLGLPAKTLDATNQTDAANQDPAADTKGQNALELPQDFDVTLRFSILGGGVYRSVGVSFDSTQVDGSINPGPQDSEIMVYVSAHAPDPKVQAAYAANGTYHYPPEGKASHPVELNRETTLRVQVRGTLVNASLNGEPKVAWRSPLARRRGALQFTAFDVQTAFHEITIQSLPQSVPMRDAGGAATLDPEKSFELARLEFEGAKSKRRIAELDVRAMERRHEAWKARWAVQDARAAKESQPGEGSKPLEPLLSEEARLVRESILQDHELAFERANLQATLGEISVLKATADKKEAAQKELASAKEKLAKSKEQWESAQKSEETAGDLARFEGGKWSPTRFFNSGADDPKPAFPETSSGRRSALANWITDPRNPLTARVAVNHLWNRHFGEPLVPNVFDFGNKGGKTPHQKLLDWLAAEFMSHGWSMKHLHRLILTSDAYQRHSSLVDAEAAIGIDPDNRLLWRRNATRIESQVVRDSILSLAGSLDGTIGGPTVPTNQQANSLRRSLYFFHSNNERNLFLTTFDEALVKECYRREQSVVPQQALALSNSQVVLDSSVRIAERLSQSEPDEEAFLRGAFELILGIRADAGMLESSRAAMARWRELPDVGLGQGSAHRERILLVWALLNHNDFVTLR